MDRIHPITFSSGAAALPLASVLALRMSGEVGREASTKKWACRLGWPAMQANWSGLEVGVDEHLIVWCAGPVSWGRFHVARIPDRPELAEVQDMRIAKPRRAHHVSPPTWPLLSIALPARHYSCCTLSTTGITSVMQTRGLEWSLLCSKSGRGLGWRGERPTRVSCGELESQR